MKLIIKRVGDFMLEVDDPTLPGSSPCGHGESIYEALGQWLHLNKERLGIEIEVWPSARLFEEVRQRTEMLKR